jgi:hypothetical protein
MFVRRSSLGRVQLHTLFVEPDAGAEYPPLLAALADDSHGVRMRASVVDASAGVIEVSVESQATSVRARHGGNRFGGRRSTSDLSDLSGLGSYPSLARLANGIKFQGFA